MIRETSLQVKLSALGVLLLEVVLLVFAATAGMAVLGVLSNLVAHFLFGYAWAWERAHTADWVLFFVLIATPLLLMGGLAWMVLRDEYRRILQMKTRKW